MYQKRLANNILDALHDRVLAIDPALLIAILTLIAEIIKWYVSRGKTSADFIKDVQKPSWLMRVWLKLLVYKHVTSKFDGLKTADVTDLLVQVAQRSDRNLLEMAFFEIKIAEDIKKS